uniref:Uncharacterized protein n=1 Tax=Octopus bimaculoides TaxID=37653 RepID=A0A0L8HKB2_OCTBM
MKFNLLSSRSFPPVLLFFNGWDNIQQTGVCVCGCVPGECDRLTRFNNASYMCICFKFVYSSSYYHRQVSTASSIIIIVIIIIDILSMMLHHTPSLLLHVRISILLHVYQLSCHVSSYGR